MRLALIHILVGRERVWEGGRAWMLVLLAAVFFPGSLAGRDAGTAVLTVWDFERGITNPHGASYNVFQREPSRARSFLDPSANPPGSTHSLRVTVNREEHGYCGIWLDFFPPDGQPRRFLDATAYHFLSLWLKGEKGGEEFEIELVDATRVEREAEGPRVSLRRYLPKGAATEWQQVVIPLEDFHGVEKGRLARVVLRFMHPGEYRFHVDDFAFRRDRTSAPLRPPDATAAEPLAGAALRVSRAMWIWNPYPLFGSEEETARLFEFSKAHRISEFYLAADLERHEKEGSVEFEVRQPESYRALLRKARGEGFRVAALAGTPEWGARKYHAAALAAVDAIVRFNRAAPPEARFDSVHFDVEPYLLLGYSDEFYRLEILKDFLEMVAKCLERVSAEPGLTLTNDVPTWFYPMPAGERAAFTVEFRGARKPVGEHLLDLLGAVTLMDYVNRADGAAGIIARALPWLEYARAGGRKVVVGVETYLEPDATVFFALGLPPEEFRQRLAISDLRDEILFEGFRLAVVSDDERFHVGLSAPREMDDEKRKAYDKTLVRLAGLLGANLPPDAPQVGSLLERVRVALARNPEWEGFEPYEVADPDSGRKVQGFRTSYRMPPATTFHGLGRRVFEEETDSAAYWLKPHASFAGLAIHYYPSFRELMEEK